MYILYHLLLHVIPVLQSSKYFCTASSFSTPLIMIFKILKGVTRSSQQVKLRNKILISSRYWNSQIQCKVRRSFLHPMFFFKAVPCSVPTSQKQHSPVLLSVLQGSQICCFSLANVPL